MLKFLLRQRLLGFEVPDRPHFDSQASTDWFSAELRSASNYLEFGSGGSTLLAAQHGIPFTTVDSDPFYLRAVQRKLARIGIEAGEHASFHYVDIGLTGPWGYPVQWRPPSPRRLASFRRYSNPPGSCVRAGRWPDLVLVDGRFRVACALKILSRLAGQRGWTLVVDDYTDRPHYHVIAQHALLDRCVGRMGVFRAVHPQSTVQALQATLSTYETVPD